MKSKLTSLFILLFSTTLILTGCASTEITQTKTDTTVELGSACTLNITDYFELGSKVNEENIILDTSSVDVNTVGNYEATVTYKKNTYKINVSVTDTTAPTITAKADIEPVEAGITIKASDYVEVTDLSNYTVYFVTDDGETETIDIPSDYREELKTTIIAVDTQDNRSDTIIVYIKTVYGEHIKEDTQAEAPAQQENIATYDEYYAQYSKMTLDELKNVTTIDEMSDEEYDAFRQAKDEALARKTQQKQSQQPQAQTPPRDPNAVYTTGDEVYDYTPDVYEYVEDTGIY